MDVTSFVEEYASLTPNEKAQCAEAIRVLLHEGLIWREDQEKRLIYAFLNRHSNLIQNYLSVAGWELCHHEHCATFQVIHNEGYHRKQFSLDTTIWLLLLRLLYAEQQEKATARLTRYPTITINDLVQRYTELPRARKYKKTSLLTALRQLQHYPLIRSVHGRGFYTLNSEDVIELLPPLEVVVPAGTVELIAAQIATYFNAPTPQDASTPLTDEDIEELDLFS